MPYQLWALCTLYNMKCIVHTLRWERGQVEVGPFLSPSWPHRLTDGWCKPLESVRALLLFDPSPHRGSDKARRGYTSQEGDDTEEEMICQLMWYRWLVIPKLHLPSSLTAGCGTPETPVRGRNRPKWKEGRLPTWSQPILTRGWEIASDR